MAFRFTVSHRVLLNTVLAAAVLRFFGIGDLSLWFDEGATWTTSAKGTWADAWGADANHPPLWRFVTRAWVLAFGDSEAALRAPAAVCGVAAVVLAYLLARRLVSPARVPLRGGFLGIDAGAPLWVAGFAAASAFWIEYAQEARAYSALLAESMGLHLLYLRWLDRGVAGKSPRGTLVGYAALAAVSLYTHYFALWVLCGHAAHALVLSRRSRASPAHPERGGRGVHPLPILVAQATAGLLFLPWFLHLVSSFRGISPGTPYDPFRALLYALWRMGVGDGLAVSDRARMDAGPAALLEQEWPIVVVSHALWFVPILLGAFALRRDRGALGFVAASVLAPVLLTLAVFPKWPLVHEKYLIEVAPFLLLLAVVGARSASAALRFVLLAGLAALHLAGLAAYHFPEQPAVRDHLAHDHPYGKEQWREAREWVAARSKPGDLVLLHPGHLPNPLTYVWDYYDRERLRKVLLPSEPLSADQVLARFPEIAAAKHAFLVLSHEETPDKDHYAKVLREAWLRSSQAGFRLDREAFPRQWGIRVFEFERD